MNLCCCTSSCYTVAVCRFRRLIFGDLIRERACGELRLPQKEGKEENMACNLGPKYSLE